MSDLDELQERFEKNLGQFLLAIQTVRVVDAAAFQRIDAEAAELARALKEKTLIPKSLLKDFRVAIKILRAEAPYIEGGKNRLIEMADRLELTFDLILWDERHEDRIPGVPRIR